MDDLSELVVRAQEGDRAAYTELVQRFRRVVIAYAYARLGDGQLAEDVAQEVFLQASFDLPSLRAPGAFAAWLRQIVLKYCDRVTRRKRRPTLPLEQARLIASAQSEPLELVEQRELRTPQGETPLQWAVSANDVAVAAALLAAGAAVDGPRQRAMHR